MTRVVRVSGVTRVVMAAMGARVVIARVVRVVVVRVGWTYMARVTK